MRKFDEAILHIGMHKTGTNAKRAFELASSNTEFSHKLIRFQRN